MTMATTPIDEKTASWWALAAGPVAGAAAGSRRSRLRRDRHARPQVLQPLNDDVLARLQPFLGDQSWPVAAHHLDGAISTFRRAHDGGRACRPAAP